MKDTTISVVPYDPLWPEQFQRASQEIMAILGDNCCTIHHVGSTAIPGIWAKPIIDMIPVVKDIYSVEQHNIEMQKLGYHAKGEHGILFRRYFQRQKPFPACNVHIYEQGSSEIARLTEFRDFLIGNPDYQAQYENLKRQISKDSGDITAYTLAKEALVSDIDARMSFQGQRIVHALSDREWEAYYRILHAQAGTAEHPVFDAKHPEASNKNNQHLVLHEGAHIIGAALITYSAENKGAISYLDIDLDYGNVETKINFRSDVERWLQHL